MINKIDALEQALEKLLNLKEKDGQSEGYYEEMEQRINDMKLLLDQAYEEEYGR